MSFSKEIILSSPKAKKNHEKLVHEFEQSLATHVTESETQHVLFSPLHYESGYAYPLIIWLHGRGRSNERQLLKVMPTISMRNFVAIAPRGIAADQEDAGWLGWTHSEDASTQTEKRVFDCLSIAREKCNIHKKRVFLVGYNDGGTAAFQLGLRFPEVFSGVVSLGGVFPQKNLGQLHAVRKLPCLISVGKESRELPTHKIAKDMMLFHVAGMSVTVRQYPGCDELSLPMLEDVNRWIMERVTG